MHLNVTQILVLKDFSMFKEFQHIRSCSGKLPSLKCFGSKKITNLNIREL